MREKNCTLVEQHRVKLREKNARLLNNTEFSREEKNCTLVEQHRVKLREKNARLLNNTEFSREEKNAHFLNNTEFSCEKKTARLLNNTRVKLREKNARLLNNTEFSREEKNAHFLNNTEFSCEKESLLDCKQDPTFQFMVLEISNSVHEFLLTGLQSYHTQTTQVPLFIRSFAIHGIVGQSYIGKAQNYNVNTRCECFRILSSS